MLREETCPVGLDKMHQIFPGCSVVDCLQNAETQGPRMGKPTIQEQFRQLFQESHEILVLWFLEISVEEQLDVIGAGDQALGHAGTTVPDIGIANQAPNHRFVSDLEQVIELGHGSWPHWVMVFHMPSRIDEQDGLIEKSPAEEAR